MRLKEHAEHRALQAEAALEMATAKFQQELQHEVEKNKEMKQALDTAVCQTAISARRVTLMVANRLQMLHTGSRRQQVPPLETRASRR